MTDIEKAQKYFRDRYFTLRLMIPEDREEVKMNEIAADALQEKAERENPKPLTLEELRQMDGEPVWIKVLGKPDLDCWGYHDEDGVDGYMCFTCDDDYGKTWLAYQYKPNHSADVKGDLENGVLY